MAAMVADGLALEAMIGDHGLDHDPREALRAEAKKPSRAALGLGFGGALP
jgi:hypothetical protein